MIENTNADLILFSDVPNATVYVISAGTDAGKEWLDENVDTPDYARLGMGIVVEHRFVDGILHGAKRSGLTIEDQR